MYRLEIQPFAKAREVLESLEVDQKLTKNGKNADIIELCNIIPNEVLGLGSGKGYDVDKGKKKYYSVFTRKKFIIFSRNFFLFFFYFFSKIEKIKL